VSRARLLLHLAALLAPFVAAALWCVLLFRNEASRALGQALVLGTGGALSAQIAALLRWRALDRRARDGSGGWQTGIGMAAITHALFGLLLDAALVASVGWTQSMGTGRPSDLVVQVIFFSMASVLTVGLVTFPFTALLAQWVATQRRKEIADGAR